MIYTIKLNGEILGHYPGATEKDALDNFALEAGFGSFEQAMRETGEDPSGITVEPSPKGTKCYAR